MPFTGKLGTLDSQLGNIVLGSVGEQEGGGTIAADFTANAVLLNTIPSLFFANAQFTEGIVTNSDTFSADAKFSVSFTANAILLKTVAIGRASNAVLKVTSTRAVTADSWFGPAPAPKLIFEDTFDRTISNEPGPADGIGHYITSFNQLDVNVFEIASGYLTVQGTLTEEYNEFPQWYGPSGPGIEAYFDFWTGRGAYYYLESASHYDSVANRWYFGILEIYDQSDTATADWRLSVDPQTASVAVALPDDTWYRAHARIDSVGHIAMARVWDRSLSEPSTWDITAPVSARVGDALGGRQLYVSFWLDIFASEARLDNVDIYSFDLPVHDFFTAHAIILKAIPTTYTANAVIASDGIEFDFTADAVFEDEIGTHPRTFVADSSIVFDTTEATLSANSYLVKLVSGSFSSNSRIVKTLANDFTADSWFKQNIGRNFTARSVIHRPLIPGRRRLTKNTTLTILQHRDRPLPTYLPPRIPDAEDITDDQLGGPPCLPPCPGAGAGYGTGFGVNGGAIVDVVTQCTSGSCAASYSNNGDNWIGKGSIGTTTHCGCETSHSQSAHINRMWITYADVPDVTFRMRAKMIWDVGAPPNVTVNVYANMSRPTIDIGDCDASGPFWDQGNLIGRMSFSADGNGTIGERSIWFQTEPSEIVINPSSISTGTFRFELADEGQFYRAEFKAANVQVVVE